MLARLLVFVVGAASFGGFPQLGGLQIRRAEVADLDSLADLRAEASPFATSYKVAAQAQATSASEERRLLRDTFCRGLDTGDAVCYVAVDRRSIVGYVDVTTRGALGPALAEHAYVKNLYILPEFRRRGLGRKAEVLGDAHTNTKRAVEALRHFRKAAKLNPKVKFTYGWRIP